MPTYQFRREAFIEYRRKYHKGFDAPSDNGDAIRHSTRCLYDYLAQCDNHYLIQYRGEVSGGWITFNPETAVIYGPELAITELKAREMAQDMIKKDAEAIKREWGNGAVRTTE